MKAKTTFYSICIIFLVIPLGCNTDQLLKTNKPTTMTVTSNIANTDFYYREQKYGLLPDEGWVHGGKGNKVDLELFKGGRYEIKAVPEGYHEKKQRFHEPDKFYQFTFVDAEKIEQKRPPVATNPPTVPTDIKPPEPENPDIIKPIKTSHQQAWAVIIGVSEYKHGTSRIMKDLAFARKDADDFYLALINQGWPDDHICKLTNESANKRGIEYALETWLRRTGPDDMIVVLWSSHAWPDPGDPTKAYFACYDSKPSDPSSGWRMDRVRQILEERNAKNVVMIADTCHAGKIIRAGDPKAIGVIPALEEMKKSRDIPNGWIFIASSDPDRKAYEDKAWSNGALSHVLLEGMSGKADGYQSLGAMDGAITLGELRGYITDRMSEESLSILGAKLTPMFYTTSGDPAIWDLSLSKK
jgi:hypothetical protein